MSAIISQRERAQFWYHDVIKREMGGGKNIESKKELEREKKSGSALGGIEPARS